MSRVSSGEVKESPTGELEIYPGKPNNNDNLIDYDVTPGDANRIYSNNFPLIDDVRSIASKVEKQRSLIKNAKSSLAKNTTQLQEKVAKMALKPYGELQDAMAGGQMGSYAKAKIPNIMGISPIARAIPTLAGLGAGINQTLWWKRQPISTPNTYAPNQNEGVALSTLASLRDNPYNQLRVMQDVERRSVNEMNRAGGLTGSQRYLASVASNLGLQRNYADVLAKSDAQNNAYRAQYANLAANLGAQDAQRRMQANQFDYNAYTAAHGRKVKGFETGIANILNWLQGGFQNEFKYRMGNKTLDMYQQQLDQEQKKIAAAYEDINNKKSTGYIFNPTYWRITHPLSTSQFEVDTNIFKRRPS